MSFSFPLCFLVHLALDLLFFLFELLHSVVYSCYFHSCSFSLYLSSAPWIVNHPFFFASSLLLSSHFFLFCCLFLFVFHAMFPVPHLSFSSLLFLGAIGFECSCVVLFSICFSHDRSLSSGSSVYCIFLCLVWPYFVDDGCCVRT